MPCITGRAKHTLKSQLCEDEDPCSCRVRDAHACRQLCWGAELVNTME